MGQGRRVTYRGLSIEDQQTRWRDPLHTIAESIRQTRERLGLDELDHNLVVVGRAAPLAKRFPRGSIGIVPGGSIGIVQRQDSEHNPREDGRCSPARRDVDG